MTTIRERFESKYMPEPNSGCWLWVGAVSKLGYGRLSVARSRHEPAYRIAWILYRGEIPDGLLVCHRCDNPYCVNPDHLFLGTHKDNTADSISKGRFKTNPRPGILNGRAILSELDVKEIRESQLSVKALAEKYNVHWSGIYRIRQRKSWRHL